MVQFPKERLRLETKTDVTGGPAASIILDLKGLDIDGVTRLEIGLEDVESLRTGAQKQVEDKRKLLELLGE